jgi:hypothetical protein
LLVIDDRAVAPLAEAKPRDFWEICEDRYQTRFTILTSQIPVARCHEQVGDPTAADGLLDLLRRAHWSACYQWRENDGGAAVKRSPFIAVKGMQGTTAYCLVQW